MSGKRDAKADLAVCAAATKGPWDRSCGVMCDWDYARSSFTTQFECTEAVSDEQRDNDLLLFSIAYAALPHWIERAETAETRYAVVRNMLDTLVNKLCVTDKQGEVDVQATWRRHDENMTLRYLGAEAKREATEREIEQLRTDLTKCQQVCQSLADRVAAQAELLGGRGGKPEVTPATCAEPAEQQDAEQDSICKWCGGEGGFYADWADCGACNGTGYLQAASPACPCQAPHPPHDLCPGVSFPGKTRGTAPLKGT